MASSLVSRWHTYVTENYGGRKAWVYHLLFRIAYSVGALRSFERVDWARVERLVFVCTGNICRSAYAEAKASSMGLPTTSFGLSADGGSPADSVAIEQGSRRRVDLRNHRSKSLTDMTVSSRDLLIGMEPRHAAALKAVATQSGAQLTLLGLWANERRPHLQDPLARQTAYFQVCFAVIDDAIQAMGKQIVRSKRCR